ncbi:choline/ethanolaminephosphotransferase 1-like, partial [Clarias magur]
MVLSGLRLSRQQLKRLEEHRYSSEGKSLLEPLMQPFWCWLVERVPLWVAPNLITSVGLVLNITTTLILTYYCPTATEQVHTHTHTHPQ